MTSRSILARYNVGLVFDCQSCAIILKKEKKSKKTLTDHLRACVVAQSGVALSGAAVAPAADGLKHGAG